MAIHQKLVLTQRLEDIEMTDLRPANVIISSSSLSSSSVPSASSLPSSTPSAISIIVTMIRVELDVVVEKLQGTAAEAAAEDIPVFRFNIEIILMIAIILVMVLSDLLHFNENSVTPNISRAASGDMAQKSRCDIRGKNGDA